MELQQIKSKGSLTDKAYDILKEAILSLDLKPGEMLIEEDISEKLGISRTPLRAALQKLSFESLVEIIPGKGTCVTELSTEYFLDLFALREVVEMLSVKLAAINSSKEDLVYIKELIDLQLKLASEKPIRTDEYLKIDRKVHVQFGKLSKNSLVEEQIIRLNEAYRRYLNFTNFEDRAVNVAREHMMIVEAIEQKDSIKAQEIMKYHIIDVKESILLSLIK